MELFSNRAKLYHFDETVNCWKERGMGIIKILKHKNTGQVRILMRRDQVLKICCNHIIVKGMKLVPRDERSFYWTTLCDLADGEPKAEKLAVKFKLSDTATAFQKVFDNSLASGIDDGEGSLNTEASSTIANVTKNANTWECQACYIPNEESVNKCIACGGDRQQTTSSGTCSITLSSALASISMPVTTTPPLSTSSNVMMSAVSSTTSLPVTTVVSAPPKPIFVFGGNNQSSQSSATTSSGFSLSPPKFTFGTGTFEFNLPMKVDMKSFPSWGGNTSISGLSQPKDTDNIAKDFQAIPSHKENPFYVDGRPVEYSISSVAMGDSAASSTIYSAVHSGSDVPPSLISISDSQQMDRGSDKKDSDSMLSIPSLETASVAPSSLFGQSRMPKWEPKILFPTEGASVGPGAGGLDSIHADNTEGEPHPEAEANIYFDPIVSLPSSFDATSGEENEDCLFTYKAKLFRYDGSLKVWKDWGIGIIKILKNKTSGKGRVLMQREQVLKLCCNHYIVPGMVLRPGSYADRSWVWFTSADLSEDTPQEETLCVKFKHAETASEFKKTFDMFATPDHADTSVSQDSVTRKPIPILAQDSASASIFMPVTTIPLASTSSNVMMSSTTSLPVTTVVSTPPKPIFVFGGNNQSSQSSLPFSAKSSSGSGFSLSPPKFAFGTGTFEFNSPFQVDMKSFPGFGVTTSSSGQSQTSGKNTDDAEVDSLSEEWLDESESEYLGSESNLEHSEDEIDEPSNHKQSVTDTSLTNTADTSTASVNTVTNEQLEENKLETDQTDNY
ncbi:ranBP2-like and GRIP domain-containing protein 3 [Dysidea avara]|uniref:ranBP2-like and GRIP domain-containing protein 3 n=1 Tax=Dysidea avara TaxID=196820 RepID=UPI003320B02C